MRATLAIAREIVTLAPGLLLFVIGPTVGVALALAPTTPRPVGVPLAIGLGIVALGASASLVEMIRDRFGLRLVVQLERASADVESTYLSGQSVATALDTLDAIAAVYAIPRLGAFGLDADAPFVDATRILSTVDVLLDAAPSAPVRIELGRIAGALRSAARVGVRARLRLVTGTGMNAPLYAELRARGF
jgi:hypothetical protein